jgi:flagellar biosynthetic protein FliS
VNPYNAYARAQVLVDETDKEQVLVRLFAALPEKIEGVKACIAQKDYERKYQELSRITLILEVLHSCLDMSYGEVSRDLAELYMYLIRRLRSVHGSLDTKALDECKTIVSNMGEGLSRAYEQLKKGRLQPTPERAAEQLSICTQV